MTVALSCVAEYFGFYFAGVELNIAGLSRAGCRYLSAAVKVDQGAVCIEGIVDPYVGPVFSERRDYGLAGRCGGYGKPVRRFAGLMLK